MTIGYILTADFVVQEAEIRDYTSAILKDIGSGNTFVEETFGILDKKIIQIFVTAIKSVKHGFRRKSYKFHLLQTDGNVFLCFLDRFFELS